MGLSMNTSREEALTDYRFRKYVPVATVQGKE